MFSHQKFIFQSIRELAINCFRFKFLRDNSSIAIKSHTGCQLFQFFHSIEYSSSLSFDTSFLILNCNSRYLKCSSWGSGYFDGMQSMILCIVVRMIRVLAWCHLRLTLCVSLVSFNVSISNLMWNTVPTEDVF